MKHKISSLRNSANTRNIKVDLNSEEYKALLSLGCQYCGVNLSDVGGSSLDRLDSSKPYISENVVPCCKRCNVAKNDMNMGEFIEWITRVHNKVAADMENVAKMLENNFNYKEAKKQVVKELKKSPSFWIKN